MIFQHLYKEREVVFTIGETQRKERRMSVLDFVVRLWTTRDEKIDSPEVIIPISYGSLPYGLTEATMINTEVAAGFAAMFANAKLVFCSSKHCFEGSDEIETILRLSLIEEKGLYLSKVIEAEPITNTIQEAQNIKQALERRKIFPRQILIVTGEMHSRRARKIYKNIFPPETKIKIYCTPYHFECEPNHPMKVQRSYWRWLLINIAHYIFVSLPGGLRLSKNLYHRSEFF